MGSLEEVTERNSIVLSEPLGSNKGNPVLVTYDDGEAGSVALWKGSELGRGNFGIVYGVMELRHFKDAKQDIKTNWSHEWYERALKVSHGRPGKVHVATRAEFKKLLLLYYSGIPVPKPIKLFCYPHGEATKSSHSAILMEMVKGKTLREWLNYKPGEMDDLQCRTVHPAETTEEALGRIETMLELVESLIKLQETGFFVDLKPRNIMVGRVTSVRHGRAESPNEPPVRVHKQTRVGEKPLFAESLLREHPCSPKPPSETSQLFPSPSTLSSVPLSETATETDQSWYVSAPNASVGYITPTCSISGDRESSRWIRHDCRRDDPPAASDDPTTSPDPCGRVVSSESATSTSSSGIYFVDLAGMVLKREVTMHESHKNDHNECLASLWFHVSDRQKIETTSSYICPEIAALVIQSDVLRGKTDIHFAPMNGPRVSHGEELVIEKNNNLDKVWEMKIRPQLQRLNVIHKIVEPVPASDNGHRDSSLLLTIGSTFSEEPSAFVDSVESYPATVSPRAHDTARSLRGKPKVRISAKTFPTSESFFGSLACLKSRGSSPLMGCLTADDSTVAPSQSSQSSSRSSLPPSQTSSPRCCSKKCTDTLLRASKPCPLKLVNLPRGAVGDDREPSDTSGNDSLNTIPPLSIGHPLVDNLETSTPQSHCNRSDWWVKLTDKSTSFMLGLILVEVFGGHRTGLTALARQPFVQSIFRKRTTDIEFRICCQWESKLHSLPGNGSSPPVSFKDIFASRCYPQKGVLGVGVELGLLAGSSVGNKVKFLLDTCLNLEPSRRPSLRRVADLLRGIQCDLRSHTETPVGHLTGSSESSAVSSS
eukprot:GHVN01011149.1.p1 GENE.GHVN01011149.1~~GHVN01011149.1.p1  ORF type:complete len:824 (-),score=72.40 GHVN01011149.1:105-2576(-)